jgi:hypothetical protein
MLLVGKGSPNPISGDTAPVMKTVFFRRKHILMGMKMKETKASFVSTRGVYGRRAAGPMRWDSRGISELASKNLRM